MSTALSEGFVTVLVTNAIATGTTVSTVFSVSARADGGDRTVTFAPNGDGTVTTLTADLESQQPDGTWSVYPGGGTLTFSALAQVQVLHLVAGLAYRLNVKSITLGTATKVSICATLS